jgi:transposase InsO family protein
MPGHAVQVDVKFIAPLASSSRKKYYQFTAIDDCTRLRVLRIYDRLSQKTAIQFVDYLLDKFPFRVEVIQTDNGSEFQTAFHWHLADRGIRHIYIKPATPRLNGKVERSHRIDGEEFYRMLKGVVIDDTQLFNDKLAEWQDFYNYHRPTAPSAARHPMNALSRRPPQRPRRKRSTSAAHRATRATQGNRAWRAGGWRAGGCAVPLDASQVKDQVRLDSGAGQGRGRRSRRVRVTVAVHR